MVESVKAIVLCGGSGTRLWPLSRTKYPKQLLTLGADESLLQATVSRTLSIEQVDSIAVICNDEYRFLVAQQVRPLQARSEVLLEPFGRNTAPAVAIAAFMALEEDPLLLVLPSDHLVTDGQALANAVDIGIELAREGHLVTFGVKPDSAHTGYGYIQAGEKLGGGFGVMQFVEKPDLETATSYVADRRYYWNSGMFLYRASAFLEELARFEPEIHACCEKIAESLTVDLDFTRISAALFESCPAKSLDYAVMEHTKRAAVVPLNAGWSDIGSYESIWDVMDKDADGNVLDGDVVTRNTTNSYLHSEHRLVATVAVDNLIVIETPDAVLVADKSRSQEVKALVEELARSNRTEHAEHRRVYRPWGYYESVDSGDRFQVKHILVNPGSSLSLQKHHHRAEHWVVVSGTAQVTKGSEVFDLSENQSTFIPIGTTHRLENPGRIPLRIIEVQSGSYLAEDDIVRLDDVYGRN